MTAGNAGPNWGTYPLNGYEVIRAGPISNEWMFWSFIKRQSDGAFDAWVKVRIWVRAWGAAATNFEIVGRIFCSNSLGPNTSATLRVAASDPPRTVCVAELYDGSSLLYAWGGPNDSRTVTIPATDFDPTASFMTAPMRFDGCGVIVSGSGTPSGLSATTPYWAQAVNNTQFALLTYRNLSGGTPSQVTFGTQGTGNATITPYLSIYLHTSTSTGAEQRRSRLGGSGNAAYHAAGLMTGITSSTRVGSCHRTPNHDQLS